MAKIIAPNKKYNGVSAGIPFVNGVGECANSHLLEWFENHGYKIEKSETVKKGNTRKKSE